MDAVAGATPCHGDAKRPVLWGSRRYNSWWQPQRNQASAPSRDCCALCRRSACLCCFVPDDTMEALLSLSFDNISSKDSTKMRKGLRQIEGVLAQICLPPSCAQKRRPSVQYNHNSNHSQGDKLAPPKQLSQVCQDPAFREFFRLQEGFEWNGKSRLGCAACGTALHAC